MQTGTWLFLGALFTVPLSRSANGAFLFTVNRAPDTSLIDVRVGCADAKEAAFLANALVEAYRNYREHAMESRGAVDLKLLLKELDLQNQKITAVQARLDKMRKELNQVRDDDTVSTLESQRIEAQAELDRIETLYTALTNGTRAEQKKTIGTAYPDDRLTTLMKEQSVDQQRLASLTNIFGPNSPDILALRDKLAVIDGQIEKQLDGILTSIIVIRAHSDRARVTELKQSVDRAKAEELVQIEKRRPYDLLKRELDSLYYVRDRLMVKVQQEALEAKLPRASSPLNSSSSLQPFAPETAVNPPSISGLSGLLSSVAAAPPAGPQVVVQQSVGGALETDAVDSVGASEVQSPPLNISAPNLKQTRIHWPTNAPGYVLESTGTLPAFSWQSVPEPIQIVDGQYSVQLERSTDQRYFRLRKR